MTDTETSSTLVKVGGWLQIPFSILTIIISAWLQWLMWPVLIDPMFWTIFGWGTALLLWFLIAIGSFGFGLAFLWLRWQHDISRHKGKLIGTSIIGITFTGTVPGLLVLIGAALYPPAKE